MVAVSIHLSHRLEMILVQCTGVSPTSSFHLHHEPVKVGATYLPSGCDAAWELADDQVTICKSEQITLSKIVFPLIVV
jgi:hypothetical protein